MLYSGYRHVLKLHVRNNIYCMDNNEIISWIGYKQIKLTIQPNVYNNSIVLEMLLQMFLIRGHYL